MLSRNFEVLKVSLPEHKPNYANLEFGILNPNSIQMYATEFSRNFQTISTAYLVK